MKDVSRAIVLSTTRYGENSLIVDLYTNHAGRLSAGTYLSKKKKTKYLYAPLSLLEIELYSSSKSKHLKIREGKSALNQQLHSQNPEVHAIRYFLADFLKKTLGEETADYSLFSFLSRQVEQLYRLEKPGDFVISFLREISPYLGFDIRAKSQGFQESYSDYGFGFSTEEWKVICGNPVNGEFRNRKILDLLLHFYQLHFDGLERMKSRDVLAQLFY